MEGEGDRKAAIRDIADRLDFPMIVLSFVWLALLVAELSTGLGALLRTVGTVIWGLFILDFVFRVWLAEDRSAYVRRNWLTVISLVVPALRMFRVFRAAAVLRSVRGVRVVRVAGSFNRALRALGKTFARRGFAYVVAATAVVVTLGAAAMLAFEHPAVGFGDYPEALWWTAMMVLSVGSEFWPNSPEGRVLTVLLALYGFSILGYVAATLTSFFLDRDAVHEEAAMAGSADIRALGREVRALREELAAGEGSRRSE